MAVAGRSGYGRRMYGSGQYGLPVAAGGEGVEVDPKIIQRLRNEAEAYIIKISQRYSI